MAARKRVTLDFETARDLLDVLQAERDGPHFPASLLNLLTLRIARQMPEEELPEYAGGTWEPGDDDA
jgi:hypothetical protein